MAEKFLDFQIYGHSVLHVLSYETEYTKYKFQIQPT